MKKIKNKLLSVLPGFIVSFFSRFGEVMLYALCGLATTFVNFGVYFIVSRLIFTHAFEGGVTLFGFAISEAASQAALWNAIAWLVSVLFSFFVNRAIVFHDGKKGKRLLLQLVIFSASRILSGLFEVFAPSAMIELLSMNDVLAKFIVSCFSVILNYAFSKFVVFRRRKNIEEFMESLSDEETAMADTELPDKQNGKRMPSSPEKNE